MQAKTYLANTENCFSCKGKGKDVGGARCIYCDGRGYRRSNPVRQPSADAVPKPSRN